MKKIFLSIILATTILTTNGQDSTSKSKVYHNEFGIDATGFVKQFLNFNQSPYSNYYYYAPTYYLTYRRHFKCGNIRFAIGGDIASQDIPASWALDENKYHSNSYSFDARIGWEFFDKLSKHWQVFYGLDFRPTYSYSKNDAPYWNAGYANGVESKSQIYGIAPLVGFRFKLTDRLSLSTEANFSINFENSSSRHYFIPETSTYPPMPDIETPKTKKMSTTFSQPVSLMLTFDI